VRLPGSILQGILARAALVLLRIYLGIIFLLAAWPSLRLPNASLVASLVTWGELLVGLTLVLGLLTRLSATVALLLMVNCMLAKGTSSWRPCSNDGALAVIAGALLIGAAGRTFGFDSLLAKRWPRSPLW
jgi:thiosulfate dehydrogenase [quinone] large subunit